VLLYGSKDQYAPAEHPFLAGLRDVGLVEGSNATLLVREAEGRPDRLPQLAAELLPRSLTSSSPPARNQFKQSRARPRPSRS
jgi:hypothetical protein